MEYADILKVQKQRMRGELKWWPDFFYHFTDVHNAIGILQSGWILSRERAAGTGAMVKDNASRAVINATNAENKRYGRLFFRPLTPTQYHSEGYKPLTIRDEQINANCPVPIFLCLDAVRTLMYPGTQFAEKGIAGERHQIQQGVEAFSNLNFEKIYHEGPYGPEDRDIKDYRHSEVIRLDGFPVEPLLRCILCRTAAEKETLLYMIRSYSMRMYNSYKDRILYRPKLKCFNNNGVFIKSVFMDRGLLKAEFNDPEQRYHNHQQVYFNVTIALSYVRQDGSIVWFEDGSVSCNYSFARSVEMWTRQDLQYDLLRVNILFDQELMYQNELDMRETELF